MTSPLDNDQHPNFMQHEEKSVLPETDEVNRIKTGHVLNELSETESVYVSELLSIINVSTCKYSCLQKKKNKNWIFAIYESFVGSS